MKLSFLNVWAHVQNMMQVDGIGKTPDEFKQLVTDYLNENGWTNPEFMDQIVKHTKPYGRVSWKAVDLIDGLLTQYQDSESANILGYTILKNTLKHMLEPNWINRVSSIAE
jgi:hypothetical protein